MPGSPAASRARGLARAAPHALVTLVLLFRRYSGAIQALFRRYSGAIKALLRYLSSNVPDIPGGGVLREALSY